MSLNKRYHIRSVYSVLDFLGDVGGLLSILISIGGVIINIFNMFTITLTEMSIIQRVFEGKLAE